MAASPGELMRDLNQLHRRLVNSLLAIVAIVLPFVAAQWPHRVPSATALMISATFAAAVLAHVRGSLSTGGAARLLVLTLGGLVVAGSVLQVILSDTPATTWAHEAHHVGRALVVTVGGLYVTLGRRVGRRASILTAAVLVMATLGVFEALGTLDVTGRGALTPLLDMLVSGLLAGLLFDVAALNAHHLAKGRRSATRLAELDALTQVNNRHGVEPSIRAVLDRPGEAGLVMLDLDHFKWINDTHGHGGGDRILREVGRVLQDNTRDVDVVGRWGGEEFVIVVPDGGAEVAIRVAERCRVALHGIRADFPISGSFGVAMVEPDDSAESLLKRADHALYRAKRRGRDRVVPSWLPDADLVEPDRTSRAEAEGSAQRISEGVLRDLILASRRRQNRN